MIFPESLQSTRWSVCSAESSLVSVVALPSLVMIQQNTPPNLLISVIQKNHTRLSVGFPIESVRASRPFGTYAMFITREWNV